MTAPPREGYVYEASVPRVALLRHLGVEVLETPGKVSFMRPMTWAPVWAHAVCEGTTSAVYEGRSRGREFALRWALYDEEFRGAVEVAWRLGGGTAAALLVDAVLASGGDTPPA